MTVIKRNGSEVTFDITKIIAAITKANESVDESIRMTVMLIFLHYILKGRTGRPQYFCSKRIITYNILRFKG